MLLSIVWFYSVSVLDRNCEDGVVEVVGVICGVVCGIWVLEDVWEFLFRINFWGGLGELCSL